MMRQKKRVTIRKGAGWFGLSGHMELRERVRAQAELVEELTALLDMDRDTVIIRDMEDRIVFWNRGAEELFGISKDQASGKRYGELLDLQYPVTSDQIKHQLESTGRWDGEVIYSAHGGAAVILQSRLSLQKDEQAGPIAILEIDNNITARKNAEAQLRESEKHYRFIANNIPDLIVMTDLRTRLTYVSNNSQRMLGFAADEIMQKGLKCLMTPASLSNVRRIVTEQILIDDDSRQNRDRAFTIESDILLKDGSARFFEFKVNFIRGADGKPANVLAVGRDMTDYRNSEKALRESEQLYLSFLHKFQGIAFRSKLDGAPVIFDGAVEEITGFTREEFLNGKQIWEKLILQDDIESIKPSWNKVRSEPHYSTQREYRIIRKDKQVRWILENIHNLCDGSGRPAFVEGTIYDVTERKKFTEELMWLASFPELNPSPVIETDLAGHIFYMSPAAMRLFPDIQTLGSKHPYLSGLNWVKDRIISEKRAFFIRDIEAAGLWYTQKIYMLENNTRMRIYSVDITESKLNSDKLRQLNQQLMDIIDFLPDATFVIDRNKRVIAWNRALEDMTGAKKEDMIGKGDHEYAIPFYGKRRPVIIDLISKSDKEMESRYSYVKRAKNSLVAEVFIPKLNNGRGMFVWIKVAPFYDDKGAVIGAIESVRDITEHKESEAILRQDREVFEDLVRDKTEELLRMQKELADAKHLSEIGALAATIAHELRNPLAAIRTAAYNIRRKAQERNLASHLDNIEKKVLESDQIINNLLSYSRIRTPHLELVDIHELVEECVNAAKDRFQKYKVKVSKKCSCKKGDFLRVDPLYMKELFNNILNNSYESFAHKAGVIFIKADYRPRGNFIISFTDNGSGISEANLKRVSQPFFTTKSKGTGLGLTVCYQLVSLHNGSLEIKSEAGKGTTVIVTLPGGNA